MSPDASPAGLGPGPSLLPRRHRYKVLLALLLASIAIQTWGLQAGPAGLAADVFRTLLSLTAFFVVFRDARERRPAAVMLAAAVIVGWARHLTGGGHAGALALTFNALQSLFLWLAVAVILRDLFRTSESGSDKVLGAICGYLLAADAWTGIHINAYLLFPSSFAIDPSIQAQMAHWHSRLAVFCYYSFSQMLTLGYSDVTPLRAPATTLSLLSALFGMFYTAVVISQFVGLAQRAGSDPA